jgi:aspartyl-tRNA(Asn)/glutamyl-tRNA(Gln) amidotransferase subunit A
MSTDFALMDLSDIATAIAERRVTSLAVTEACLARIRQWQPEVNCFIRMDEAAALETACQCDLELARGHRRGVLHGVPLAHKDLFYRAGRISTAGSGILRDYKPNFTATVLRRLDEAGAVDLGTLNMSEFAAGPTGHNVHFGDCRNAFDRTCVAGGSSSGSAVAVAARLAFGALGTDTGASIRLPAAANGVTGLKPTYGRVSRHGVFPR